MEFVIQIIREFVIELPGAFIRWCYYGKKGNFFKFVEEDKSIYNYLISLILIFVVIGVVILLK